MGKSFNRTMGNKGVEGRKNMPHKFSKKRPSAKKVLWGKSGK